MITEEKYLEAKKLVADYESEQLNKHIVAEVKPKKRWLTEIMCK